MEELSSNLTSLYNRLCDLGLEIPDNLSQQTMNDYIELEFEISTWFVRLLEYVQDNETIPIGLENLLEEMGFTPNNLHELTADIEGRRTSNINRRREQLIKWNTSEVRAYLISYNNTFIHEDYQGIVDCLAAAI